MQSVLGMAGASLILHLFVDVDQKTVWTTLICLKGGYVSLRHNALRDLNAEMQREICKDVVVEPKLLPVRDGEVDGTSADRACIVSFFTPQ